MAGSGVSRLFGIQNQQHHQQQQPFFISGSSSSSFLGSSSMVSFEDVCGTKRTERPFFRTYDQEENGDDDYDDYFHQPEKKRRLSVEQVQFLEKSFETDNKLEPDRKVQLAKDLGLQPRQVAIWFQNRRARWKTKQLEKDYDTMQANFNNLKADYDNLLKEKEKLQAEVVHLNDKLQLKEKEQGNHTELSNVISELKSGKEEPIIESGSESEDQHVSIFPGDMSSAKSDVLDSDSPHYADGCHSSFAEPCDSSYAFEADQSDISQDDEDYLSKSLMPSSHVFPKMEDANYADPPSNSCSFSLPTEDHSPLFWPYWDVNLKM